MKKYGFYGWETHFAKEEKRLRYEYLRSCFIQMQRKMLAARFPEDTAAPFSGHPFPGLL